MSLIDPPHSSTKRSDIAVLEDLAMYDANQLGLALGRQAQATRYYELVKGDTEAFHDGTEAVAEAYLVVARESFLDK